MLNIFLGNACNFTCGYCLQSKESPVREKQPDYDKFVDTFADKTGKGIAYWGGEPLLYWKDIREIQNRFVAKGLKIPFIKIMTNGSLITDECVADANEWGASIRLSYHGAHDQIRYDKLKNLNDFGITYVLTAQNYNIYDCFKHTYEAEKLMERKTVSTYAHWVRATPATPKEYYFSEEDLRNLHVNMLNVAKDAMNGERRSCEFFYPHFTEWKDRMKSGVDSTYGLCSSPGIINVTLNGDFFNCHHSSDAEHKMGNVHTKTRNLNAELAAKHFISTTTCQTCQLKSWCKGNCQVSQTHAIDCKLSKIKNNVFEFLELSGFSQIIERTSLSNKGAVVWS